MSSYKMAGQALVDDFLKTVSESVLAPLKNCQKKISWQKELQESKKFQELSKKMTDVEINVRLLKENLPAREQVVETLSSIKANRMVQFMGDKEDVEKQEQEMLDEILAPYQRIIPMLEDIRKIQYSLVSQARLMKLPASINEVTGELKKIEPEISGLKERLKTVVARIKAGIDV